MNCIVQALTHTPLLRDYFLSDRHICKMSTESQQCLVCEMARLFQEVSTFTHFDHLRLRSKSYLNARTYCWCVVVLLWTAHPAHAIPSAASGVDACATLGRIRAARRARVPHRGTRRSASPLQRFFFNLFTFILNPRVIFSVDIISLFKSTGANGKSLNNPHHCSCIIDQIFTGGLQSDVTCQKCKSVKRCVRMLSERVYMCINCNIFILSSNVSTTIDPFWDISLDLGPLQSSKLCKSRQWEHEMAKMPTALNG